MSIKDIDDEEEEEKFDENNNIKLMLQKKMTPYNTIKKNKYIINNSINKVSNYNNNHMK